MSRPSRRRDARHAAIQMLYQWEVGQTPIEDVVKTYWRLADEPPPPDDPGRHVPDLGAEARAFATQLAVGVATQVADLDPYIADAAKNWRVTRMAVLDRLIMRLAVYEFLHVPETPRAVVINEALELTKLFSGDEAGPFVNGILDAIQRRIADS